MSAVHSDASGAPFASARFTLKKVTRPTAG
jgi:hypothetical protein